MRTTRTALVDAGALLLLGGLALLGFRQTYAGWWFMIAGGVGLVAGVAVAAGLRALRQPVIVVAAALLVVFVLLGEVLVLPGRPPFALATMRDLSASAVYGWKQLLTTLPPVPSRDPLLVVPYILGLVGGGGGYLLARAIPAPPARRAAPEGRLAAPRRALAAAGPLLRVIAPAVAPVGMLAAVIAFGTDVPGAELADGVAFTVAAMAWLAVRRHWTRPLAAPGTRRLARLATTAALFSVASLGAVLLSPVLPGAQAAGRSVLRDQIVPPFDIHEYPSPLAGFRKYTKAANNLYDQTLFTVTGLPTGATIRIASLDDYDGLVWGASNGVANDGFQRVGAVISAPVGTPVTVRVHITAAYAAQPDLSAWVPASGTLVSFDLGSNAASTLHVNRAADDAIVTGRLHAGDSYAFTSVITTPAMPADVQPFGVPSLTESAQSLLGARIATWTAGATGRGAQLKAVADYLRNTGAYSDGGKNEGMFLPGHSIGRLSSFANGPQPVGDDEQYAAAYALVANDLGIPARVVFGARPESDGSVRGKDVHAWVEVHVADGSWVPIPESVFMPDQSRHPDQQPPQDTQNVKAAVVPPPNAVHKPTSVTDSQTNETVRPPHPPGRPSLLARIWAILAPILTWAGPPIALAVLFAAAVLGRKRRRRRRRRTAGSTANRHAGGWREIVDLARDAGLAMPAGQTRQQQAERVLAPGEPVRPGRHRGRKSRLATALTVRVDPVKDLMPPYAPETADAIRDLADAADLAVYGPGDPEEAAVRAYWSRVDAVRKAMLERYGRRRRVLIRLSLASLRSRA